MYKPGKSFINIIFFLSAVVFIGFNTINKHILIKTPHAQVPQGIIIAWPGTIASIPSGWSRVTDFDGNFLEGTTSNPSSIVGGGSTHTHISPSHNHGIGHSHPTDTTSVARNSSTVNAGSGSGAASSSHTHLVNIDNNSGTNNPQSANFDSASNEPPYREVIWLRSNGSSDIPPGSWVFMDTDTLPSNWSRQNSNRFLKGAPSNTDAGSTGGISNSHTHTDLGHTHTENSHTHSASTETPQGQVRRANGSTITSSTHTHSLSNGSTLATEGSADAYLDYADSQPPFYTLNVVQNDNSSADLPSDIIALWDGQISNIPPNWELCDGTGSCPNLNDKFIKGAGQNGEIGTTGGSLTHTHQSGSSHAHTINTHIHNFTVSNLTVLDDGVRNSGYSASAIHYHDNVVVNGSSTTGDASVTANANVDNRPSYKEVVYIKYKPPTNTPPNTPNLDSPGTGTTAVALNPIFKTTATDNQSDNLQYKIELCTNEVMTVGCSIFDQSSSQIGWSGQNADSGTAYTSGTQSIFTLQFNLVQNSTYYWRSYAIDPGGSNSWSSTQSAPFSFITRLDPFLVQASYRWSNDDGGEVRGVGTSWYSENWNYRMPITVTNYVGSSLTNFQIGFTLATNSLVGGNKLQADCDDLRFTDTDALTEINFWIESGCNSSGTIIYVKVPTIAASSSKTIYVYYGNSSAESLSNGVDTFDFFDDFNNGSLNTSIWNDWNPYTWGSVSVAGGTLAIVANSTGGSEYHRGILTDNTFSFSNHIIETRTRWIYGGDINTNGYFQANGIRITDQSLPSTYNAGNQYYLDYMRYNGIFNTETHNYIFTKFTSGSFNEVTKTSISNDNPSNFEIQRFNWYSGPTQSFLRSTGSNLSFSSVWSGTDSLFSLPIGRYFGFTISSKQGSDGSITALLDWIRIRKYASANPLASLNSEENKPTSTTTWKENENTPITNQGINTNIRLRVSVANDGGLSVNNFRLQSAPLGVALSCVNVASPNYTDVPTTAGSSIAVMTTSPHIVDQDPTTRQLTEASTNFVSGKLVEYPSNQSDSISLGYGDYTEVEYNFQLTSNASSNTTYCFRAVTQDQSLNFYSYGATLTTQIGNQPPNPPSNLIQAKTDNSILSTSQWLNQNSVKFTVNATDPDNPDTLYLCIENKSIGTSFTNIEDSCGSGVAFSGIGVTLTHTLSSLPEGQYHWQARIKDSSNAYSSWVTYGSNLETERDFGVDLTSPTGGIVYDGLVSEFDQDFNDGSLSQLSANWSGVNSDISGLSYYEYSIGTSFFASDIKNWTNNGVGLSAMAIGLSLSTSNQYYFNIRAVDNASNTQTAISSDGQYVAPTLSVDVNPASVVLSNLGPANNYSVGGTATLLISTNAYHGYIVKAHTTSLLRSSLDSEIIINNYNGGTYQSPSEWLSNYYGFGYHSSDDQIQGVNRFNSTPCPGGGSPPCFAPFTQNESGDIVADYIGNVVGTPISDQYTITYKVQTQPSQSASEYSTQVVYSITPNY